MGVDKALYMKSTAGNDGSYTLTVSFAVGTDPDINTVNVNNRVQLAMPQLPEDVRRQGVTVKKKSSAILQVLAVYSPDQRYDTLFLSNYATINVLDSIKRVPGVGDAYLFGALDYSMRVWVSTDRMTALGLTPNDIAKALQGQNIQAAVGRIGAQPSGDAQFQLNIQTKGRLTEPEEFANVVIRANPDGSFVRVRDVGRVELGARTTNSFGRFNGGPGALIAIFQAPGANALATAEGVQAVMQRMQAQFPEGVAYKTTYDSTAFVLESIDQVIHTLIEAFVLVVIVVFLFLGNVRATLIPLIAVPVSLIGTFAVMLAMGFSLNMVSLLALVLAIGIVVDDAIVVVEAVEANLEENPDLSPSDAAKRAMGQITAPIIAITLVLLSVFVPVAFIPGISGQLYQQFAVAVAVSMVISAINALSLAPALCAVLLRHHHGPKRGPIRYVLGAIDWARDGYAAIVARLVRIAVFSLVVIAGVIALNAFLFKVIPTGFLPEEDQGAFFVEAQLPEGASVNRTAVVVERIEGILKEIPGIADISSVVGYSTLDALSKSNSAYFIVLLKPFAERTEPGQDVNSIIAKVRAEGAAIREANIIPFNVPPIIGLGTGGGFEYQLLDQRGGDPADLAAVARGADLRRQPGPQAQGRVHDLLGQHAAAVPRYRSRQGADAGDQPGRRLQRAAGDARRLLHQRSEPVRPHLAAQPAGRAGRPRLDRRHLPDPRPQSERRHGAAAQLRRGAYHHRSAGDRALQQLPLRDHQWQPGARGQLGRGAGRDDAALGRDPAAGLQLRMDRYRAAGDSRRPARPR